MVFSLRTENIGKEQHRCMMCRDRLFVNKYFGNFLFLLWEPFIFLSQFFESRQVAIMEKVKNFVRREVFLTEC